MTDSAPAESTTNPTRSIAARLWVGSVIALTVTAGWFLLAVTRPTTIYHFDPFLVVIAPVALMRFRSAASLWQMVLAGSGIGAGLALATTMLDVAVVVVSTLIRQARGAH